MRILSATALSLFLISAAPVFAQDLPDGAGKDVVVKACTSCHDADNFTSKKHNKDEWKSVVDTMIGYGAEISDEDSEVIVTYLTKNFGKEAAAAKETVPAPEAAPGPKAATDDGLIDAPGKDVVVKACTSCHGADNFNTKVHTKDEWKAVVDTMIGYGAEITDEQSEVIVNYLVKNYGKQAAGLRAPAQIHAKP